MMSRKILKEVKNFFCEAVRVWIRRIFSLIDKIEYCSRVDGRCLGNPKIYQAIAFAEIARIVQRDLYETEKAMNKPIPISCGIMRITDKFIVDDELFCQLVKVGFALCADLYVDWATEAASLYESIKASQYMWRWQGTEIVPSQWLGIERPLIESNQVII